MNHFISLTTAAEMTRRFREQRENILKTEHQNQNLLPIAETYDKASFQALLDKPEATGLRIYYGMDEYLKIHAIGRQHFKLVEISLMPFGKRIVETGG